MTLDLSIQWKGLCTKAVNLYWTKSLVAYIKTKKSLRYLSTNSLRVGLPQLIWRDIQAGDQVKRSIVRARILTGTYTLQSNRYTFSNETVNSTCLHCQLEDEDIHNVVCRCPAFYEYRVSALSQLRRAVIEATDPETWSAYLVKILGKYSEDTCMH